MHLGYGREFSYWPGSIPQECVIDFLFTFSLSIENLFSLRCVAAEGTAGGESHQEEEESTARPQPAASLDRRVLVIRFVHASLPSRSRPWTARPRCAPLWNG